MSSTLCKNLDTHLWPISCAMVKAEPRPMSSLMLQLLSGSHIPATEAKPEHTANKHTQRGSAESTLAINDLSFIECIESRRTISPPPKHELFPPYGNQDLGDSKCLHSPSVTGSFSFSSKGSLSRLEAIPQRGHLQESAAGFRQCTCSRACTGGVGASSMLCPFSTKIKVSVI